VAQQSNCSRLEPCRSSERQRLSIHGSEPCPTSPRRKAIKRRSTRRRKEEHEAQKQHASAAAPFIKPCGTGLNAPATDRLIEPPAVREARVAMLARSRSVGLCLPVDLFPKPGVAFLHFRSEQRIREVCDRRIDLRPIAFA